MNNTKTHDSMCPTVAIHPWQICLCPAIVQIREQERKDIELEKLKETINLLKKIIDRRDQILSENFERERQESLRRLEELENDYQRKRGKGRRFGAGFGGAS